MKYLLFPGRHLVNTRFQEEYLYRHLRPPLEHLVFAVTSSNQSRSRYNPIPFPTRAIALDRFARGLASVLDIRYSIFGVPHHRPTDRFAELVLKEVAEQSDGALLLNPENTVVLCSTPALIEQYRELGYEVLTAEAEPDGAGGYRFSETTPVELVRKIGELGPAALDDETIRARLHPATMSVLKDFPAVACTVQSLYGEPLLGEEGSLTETRDYDTYVRSMGSAMEVKYGDIREFLVPGRIIDEGCADGALLARIARDQPDSDLIGVDLSAEMLARAAERQRAGDFSGCFVFFRQCNLMKPLPLTAPVDTVICNSTLHEIWSYGKGEASVREYLELKHGQLRQGGRLVARDVVGPTGRQQSVLLWCNPEDGANGLPMPEEAQYDRDVLEAYLETLSTRARFLRFFEDFRPGHRRFEWEEAMTPRGPGFCLKLQQAMEFITKMSYTDNWRSEMGETFCFWSLDEWKAALEETGFRVLPGTHAYANEWRVKNRFEGRVALFDVDGKPLPFPETNMVLAAEKV